ncbi:hypothetical protein PV08_10373 [Exophiala spinifera]|uniref:Uncharacterized protein n=1 Tax=Exophiala spinifera TaxID=91928 RepID=A0A0D2BI96_9EURO|nr:uncharacterized protein PV08_10373 [Exophiala spinifera]KIW11074.1 hypothetical protein PV08_10373 [Exophiala spinifera]
MCLYNFFPCISHDAQALHKTLFEEINASFAVQAFRCKWYHCANLRFNGGSKLCPYLIIRHQTKKPPIEELSRTYRAVLENEVLDHGCGKCWDTVRKKGWVQSVHTQMANNLNMMPVAWAETHSDREEEQSSHYEQSSAEEGCESLVTESEGESKGKRKRRCSEVSIPPPPWNKKSKKVCMSDVGASPSGSSETDSEQESDEDEEEEGSEDGKVESDLDQEDKDYIRACQESLESFERENNRRGKGKGKEKEIIQVSTRDDGDDGDGDDDEAADPDLQRALQASLEEQEAPKNKNFWRHRPDVDRHMRFGSGGESSSSKKDVAVAPQQPLITPPNSQKSPSNSEEDTRPNQSYGFDVVALLKEKVAWQKEKAALISENARLLQTNMAHVERGIELERRNRELEELCFPTDDHTDAAERG